MKGEDTRGKKKDGEAQREGKAVQGKGKEEGWRERNTEGGKGRRIE